MFEEYLQLFINNGSMVACLVYFMYRDFKFMNLISDTLTALKEANTQHTNTLTEIKNILLKKEIFDNGTD